VLLLSILGLISIFLISHINFEDMVFGILSSSFDI